MQIRKLIKGNKRFKSVHFPKLENKFDNLVEYGQNPDVLFIGCSDSRVVPDLIVDSKPGDMFIIRNIANFVPPYQDDTEYHGTSAAIEYAISVLKVKDIIVCGHSHCGGCEALYQDISNEPHLFHVHKWLDLGQRAKHETLTLLKHNMTDKEKLYRLTEKISIKHQLENLLSYPEIYRKVTNGELNIHGWYYKIEDGSIEYYNSQTDNFEPLN